MFVAVNKKVNPISVKFVKDIASCLISNEDQKGIIYYAR